MKKIITYCILFSLYTVQAQFTPSAPWMQELQKSKSNTAKESKYNEIVSSFTNYWKNKDAKKKGSGYKPFMRWDEFHKNSVLPDGTLPSTELLWNALEQKKKMLVGNQKNATSWTPMGPFDHENSGSWSPGQGRVNVAIIDPNNSNIMYVGTPAGGLWKSTNNGTDWTPLTDDLPQLGVSGIAIDPKNSNIIYISTGDDDARDSYGIGVMKSTDGGNTWIKTGVDNATGNDIYIDPNNSNNLWVATDKGLFKTTNAGGNWTKTLNGNIKDIKLKPGNANIIYAATSNTFYKSTNAGNSFNVVRNGLPSSSGRLVLEVTPANPEYVYVLSASTDYSFQGLYISTNSGGSFTKTQETENIFESTQAWYDLAFTVSDTNPNVIFVGVLNIWKSTNRGDSFSRINHWAKPNEGTYTHADIHFLRYYNGTLLCGSDGGIYRSTNNGGSFANLTKGLQIGQFYRISVAQNSSSDKLTGGLQDNGGYALKNSTWNNYYGADGMDCAVSGNDSNTYYGFTQNGGSLYKTRDRGTNRNFVTNGPENGNWVTPLVSDKNGVLYAGFSSFYKLQNNSFVKQTDFNFGGRIDYIDIDPSNENIIYIARDENLYKTTNKGLNWNKVSSFSRDISSIEVHNDNSNIVYVSTAGSFNGGVYKSTDQGFNFTNITENLPNEGKFIIRHEKGTESIYLGTYIGVYHKDGSQPWTNYSSNLPAVAVRDIEINLQDNVLIAGTYGRGIWKAPLASVNNIDNQPPTNPKNLRSFAITDTSFNIAWDISTDNVALEIYEIYFGNEYRAAASPDANAVTLQNLTPNTTYQVKIRAKDTSGNLSGFSNTITVITTGGDKEAPSTPNGLNASNITDTSFSLSWNASTDNVGVTGYDVFEDNVKIKSVSGTSTTINGLTTSTAYKYRVVAIDAAGNKSEISNELNVTTLDSQAPSVPNGLSASNVTKNSLTLSWNTATDNVGVIGYDIYQNNTKIKTVTTTSSNINGLTPDTNYQYRIKAKDAAGNQSGFSNLVTVTTEAEDTEAPTAPTALNTSNITETSVDLYWNASTDNTGVTAYDIYKDNTKIKTVTTTNSSINGLITNESYTFKVRAKDAAGNESSFSNSVVVTTTSLTSDCTNSINDFPYNQGFENNLSDWTQSSVDDIDWSMNSGRTLSYQTGPSNANEGESYMYVEASGSNIGYPYKSAILNSPCIDLTNTTNPKLSFSYHMYGSNNMGSLALEVKTQNSNNWSIVWEESGNKGDTWLQASINLNTYVGSTIELRFNRTTGATWQADVAIDNVSISAGLDICEGVETWDANQRPYNVGDNVVYYNNLFIRTNTGWDYLGRCGIQAAASIEDRNGIQTPSLEEDMLKIYPNPVTTNLNILVPNNANTRYSIIDLLGKVVASGKYITNINVSKLESGIYILKISSPKKKYIKRFIKRK